MGLSLRQMAKLLDVSPAYLSYMLNGKRPWKPELHKKYVQLVNSVNKNQHNLDEFNFVTDEQEEVYNEVKHAGGPPWNRTRDLTLIRTAL